MQSSALSRDAGVLLPYRGLSLARWPARRMLRGRDMPASARPARVLGMGTGCRHPNPPQRGMSWRCEPRRGDSARPGGHWLLPYVAFPSLLSQPLGFGRESASANGKLTSESVHTCNQQCQGKETRIYPPPVVLDNASACSLSSS